MGQLLWFLSRSDHCKPQSAGDQNIFFCGLFSRTLGRQSLRLVWVCCCSDWPLLLINKSFPSTRDAVGGDNWEEASDSLRKHSRHSQILEKGQWQDHSHWSMHMDPQGGCGRRCSVSCSLSEDRESINDISPGTSEGLSFSLSGKTCSRKWAVHYLICSYGH